MSSSLRFGSKRGVTETSAPGRHAAELHEEAVARLLEQATGMAGDLGVDDLAPQRCQPRQGACFVSADQAREAHDIGDEDRSEAALRAHSGSPAMRSPSTYILRNSALAAEVICR